MTTAEDMQRISDRMMPVSPDAQTDLERLERTLDALERDGLLSLGEFDPLRYEDVSSILDPYDSQNIPEGK